MLRTAPKPSLSFLLKIFSFMLSLVWQRLTRQRPLGTVCTTWTKSWDAELSKFWDVPGEYLPPVDQEFFLLARRSASEGANCSAAHRDPGGAGLCRFRRRRLCARWHQRSRAHGRGSDGYQYGDYEVATRSRVGIDDAGFCLLHCGRWLRTAAKPIARTGSAREWAAKVFPCEATRRHDVLCLAVGI